MSHHRSELLKTVGGNGRKFPYPKDTFRTLRRHYADIGDRAMVDLLTHEMERHERIQRKLNFEREATDEDGT